MGVLRGGGYFACRRIVNNLQPEGRLLQFQNMTPQFFDKFPTERCVWLTLCPFLLNPCTTAAGSIEYGKCQCLGTGLKKLTAWTFCP